MRIFCSAKDSHLSPTKNNSVFVILTFKILTKRFLNFNKMLTKDVVNFEQPAPGI